MSDGELLPGCLPQLNIVLLGGRNSGKSSLGNLILGKEEFVGRERTCCCRRVGAVSGRWLTVVDTPGWWCDFSSEDTCGLVKREIRSSVCLCPPGPHAFLIAVKGSSAFSERRRRAVEEHVALLGEGVWGHCMVVFTSGLRATPAAEEGELGQTRLRWLVDKCGHRSHAVSSGGGAAVAQLLAKIQELVRENGNRAFETQHHLLQALVEEKRRVEEEAERRFLRAKQRRWLLRETLRPVTDLRIVLLGARGSGKTSTLNTILGRESGPALGRTAQCWVGRGLVFGRLLTLVDTPGWWMNYFSEESSRFDRDQLILSPSLCPPGPHVFLLTVRVDRAFTETYSRAVQEHVQLVGRRAWDRTIVLFTFGDWLGGTAIELCVESEGPPLTALVERCSNRYHLIDNRSRGDGVQVRELIRKVEEMLAGCADGPHSGGRREVLEQVEEKVRREEERAKERLMRKERRRQMGKPEAGRLQPPPQLRATLLGGRKTGKSSCGNTILSRRSFCTNAPTSSCREDRAQVFGRSVAVLDTPACFSLTPDLLEAASVLLLVVNVSSSFSEGQGEALEKQVEAAGARGWSRAVVLFSHGDWLGPTSIERRIESEGPALQRLVEKCGDRYHVLDNRHWGHRAQVEELMELMEQMLIEDGLDVPHRGGHVGSAAEEQSSRCSSPQLAHTCESNISTRGWMNRWRSSSPSISSTVTQPATSSDTGGQMVPLGAEGGQAGLSSRDDITSCLVCLPPGRRLRWTLNVPGCFSAHGLHLRTNAESLLDLLSPRRPRMLLALPQASADHAPPALRGLQALADHWDHSNLEELEAFIDLYFEMVWGQRRGSPEFPELEEQSEAKTGAEEVLSSIDRKLSKLELLEEIQKELKELRSRLEHSWKLAEEHKRDQDT